MRASSVGLHCGQCGPRVRIPNVGSIVGLPCGEHAMWWSPSVMLQCDPPLGLHGRPLDNYQRAKYLEEPKKTTGFLHVFMKLHRRAPQRCSRGSSSVWLQCGAPLWGSRVRLQCWFQGNAPMRSSGAPHCGVTLWGNGNPCDVPIWSSSVGWALLWTPTTDSTVDFTVDPTVGQDFIV